MCDLSVVIVYYIPRWKRTIVYRETCPRDELVLQTQEWYFRRGLYTILFTINHLIKQATL
jgi:hypothetical protein